MPVGFSSAARIAANRANAQKSTGPKTPEGKARSAQNAYKHGFRSQAVLLPNEDPQPFFDRLAAWTLYLKPANSTEAHFVRLAVDASWKLDRCRDVDTAVVTELADNAVITEDNAQAEEVELWSSQLADNPAGSVRKLRQTGRGCKWLIGRWQQLRWILNRHHGWQPTLVALFFHLLGKRREQLFGDDHVYRLLIAMYVMASPEKPSPREMLDLLHEQIVPGPTEHGEDELYWWAGVMVNDDWIERAEAEAKLAAVIDEQLSLLEREQVEVEAREARQRASAPLRASIDVSIEGQRRSQYEGRQERKMRGALRDLWSAQRARRASAGEPSTVSLESLLAVSSWDYEEAIADEPLEEVNEPSPSPAPAPAPAPARENVTDKAKTTPPAVAPVTCRATLSASVPAVESENVTDEAKASDFGSKPCPAGSSVDSEEAARPSAPALEAGPARGGGRVVS